MDIAKQYEDLAKQLGDIEYKLLVLREKREELINSIKRLDEVAGIINAQKNKAQSGSNGSSSPS